MLRRFERLPIRLLLIGRPLTIALGFGVGPLLFRDLTLVQLIVDRGAEAIIAGCTEIPLVLDQKAVDVPLISSTDVLAEETVRHACGDKPLPA